MRVRPDIAHETIEGPHLLLQRNPAGAWKAIEAFLDANGLAAKK